MSNAVLLTRFPNLRQTYGHDCGPQALQSVLVYYGLDIREDEIMRVTKHTTEESTHPQNLTLAIEHYGLHYEAREMTTDEVKDFISRGIPVILALQAWAENHPVDWKNDWGDGHYVVAIGYDDEKMIFEDPADFRRTYLLYGELEERWHDRSTDGKEYTHLGIAVYGKDPSPLNEEPLHME